MPNFFSRISNAVQALFTGPSANKNAAQANDADRSSNGRHVPNSNTSRTERSATQSARSPTGGSEAASRRRIEQSHQPLSINEKRLATALALSAIDNYPDFKEQGRRFRVHIGPARSQKSLSEEMALMLVTDAINANPELKGKGVQFNIQELPGRIPSTDQKNLALALALSAIEHDPELKNSGHKFDVRIGEHGNAITEAEDLALTVGLFAIENEPSLKHLGLQINVRIKPTSDERSDEDNLAIGIALSELSFEEEQKSRLAAAS